MRCFGDLCFASVRTRSPKPLDKEYLEKLGTRALAVAVRLEAVDDWRYLLQALSYAYAYRGPARDPKISALMYLTASDSIEEAEARASPIGALEFVVGIYGERIGVEAEAAAVGGEPYYPEGSFNPWKITNFALSRLT